MWSPGTDELADFVAECRVCSCRGDCEEGCVWTETNLCSQCYGERCRVCESERAVRPDGLGLRCWQKANRIAQDRRDMKREHVEQLRHALEVDVLEEPLPPEPED